MTLSAFDVTNKLNDDRKVTPLDRIWNTVFQLKLEFTETVNENISFLANTETILNKGILNEGTMKLREIDFN